MRPNLLLIASVSGLLVTGLACNDEPTSPKGCIQNVQVIVDNAATPTFLWAPTCGMSSLSVETVPSTTGGVGAGEIVWGFSVPERNPVGPGIRYGHAPSGATSPAPRPLVAGTSYRVVVQHTVGGDGLLGHGEAVFTH